MTLEDYQGEKPQTPEEQLAAAAGRIARLEDDLRLTRAAKATAEKRAAEAERIREQVFGLHAQPLDQPEWVTEQTHAASGAPHVPKLVTSDFQWGETIFADNMDGINEFNIAIAEDRYRLLIDRTLDISFNHLAKNKYSGILYLRGGDQVSGDIHAELRETNELAAIPAVRSLVAAETWGIKQLVDAFGLVHVVSVPGNHGRTQVKPPYKRISDNYDTLSAWWLEDAFRGDSRITWQTPASTDAVYNLHGRKYLLTHGDNIGSSGGQGFIGPAATILRGMKKTMDEYAVRGTVLSKMFVGHFHNALDLGRGWANGCLPGYSEFARGNRMTPEPPIQWLIYFHPRYGATSQWKILLAPEPAGGPVSHPFVEVSR
jgi:hypothetical protein